MFLYSALNKPHAPSEKKKGHGDFSVGLLHTEKVIDTIIIKLDKIKIFVTYIEAEKFVGIA